MLRGEQHSPTLLKIICKIDKKVMIKKIILTKDYVIAKRTFADLSSIFLGYVMPC